jgi:hypothetical protein
MSLDAGLGVQERIADCRYQIENIKYQIEERQDNPFSYRRVSSSQSAI